MPELWPKKVDPLIGWPVGQKRLEVGSGLRADLAALDQAASFRDAAASNPYSGGGSSTLLPTGQPVNGSTNGPILHTLYSKL